ncbi:arginase [Aspergillus affinis]|uniref:arginase n=1 Tax=Aspergillus affinis TaxID=1070780 RepID=UPI0022FE09E8|nr:arginase [Aspergillus affinis]KAI9040812.1 arginase [Aspergillus affinis]
MKRPRAVSTAAQHINQKLYEHTRQGSFVLTLGRNHSIGIGTVSGTAKAIRERFSGSEMAVFLIDAHADINTPETSLSGRIHGMPVAFVSGLFKLVEVTGREYEAFGWIENEHMINLKRFVYIGLRNVDEAEKETIEKYGIKALKFPVAPGLSLEESRYIAKRLHQTENLVAMDLVEISPQVKSDKLSVTVDSRCSVISNALGVSNDSMDIIISVVFDIG